jgi:hypothetical protein
MECPTRAGLERILGNFPRWAPTKPTELGFDGFVGSSLAQSAKIRASEYFI